MTATSHVPKSRVGRIVLIVLVAIVAVNLVLVGVQRVTGGTQGGPPSSSYSTGPQGMAAYADLLRRAGHNVQRLRQPIADSQLDRGATVFVLDATISATDAQTLAIFVRSGGRLVCGGLQALWLRHLVADPPSLVPIPAGDAVPLVPVPELAGVSHVRSDEPAVWTKTHSALPVLTSAGRSLLAVQTLGAGRIDFLASASPLQNALLAAEDDAAFGLALAGETSRPVVFAEGAHGFSQGGLRAIPARARWTFAVLAFAVLVWMGARVRRLGPPMAAERLLAPPRRLFVESLAQTLARTRDRGAASAPVRAAARERVARVAALTDGADDAAWRAAALRAGLTEAEISAIIDVPSSDADVVLAGRTYAKLAGRNR